MTWRVLSVRLLGLYHAAGTRLLLPWCKGREAIIVYLRFHLLALNLGIRTVTLSTKRIYPSSETIASILSCKFPMMPSIAETSARFLSCALIDTFAFFVPNVTLALLALPTISASTYLLVLGFSGLSLVGSGDGEVWVGGLSHWFFIAVDTNQILHDQ